MSFACSSPAGGMLFGVSGLSLLFILIIRSRKACGQAVAERMGCGQAVAKRVARLGKRGGLQGLAGCEHTYIPREATNTNGPRVLFLLVILDISNSCPPASWI